MYEKKTLYLCLVDLTIKPRDKFNKKIMAEQLHIKKGTGAEIARLLGVSRVTVSHAIRGHSDSDIARRIRRLAKKVYGAVVVDEK